VARNNQALQQVSRLLICYQKRKLGLYFWPLLKPKGLKLARGKKVISWLPQDKVLLETDGPFAKVEGKILFPSDVKVVLDHLGTVWNLDLKNTLITLRQNLVEIIA